MLATPASPSLYLTATCTPACVWSGGRGLAVPGNHVISPAQYTQQGVSCPILKSTPVSRTILASVCSALLGHEPMCLAMPMVVTYSPRQCGHAERSMWAMAMGCSTVPLCPCALLTCCLTTLSSTPNTSQPWWGHK